MINQSGAETHRREEILAAAVDLFWSKGYHATSMNDVADAMDMRKASLYHHIDSKQTLLFEISVSSMRHITDALAATNEVRGEKRLQDIIVRHLQALLSDRNWHATALVELRSLSPKQRAQVVDLRRRYERLIDDALLEVQHETGRWRGLDIRLVRMGLLGMLNWTVFWFSPDGPETAESIAKSFCAVFMPAITD
jgi:TetR/AcrR family transcriptional regulator, cholesterol catabolism regulator